MKGSKPIESTDNGHETRLTIRLQGLLAAHADRQVESTLYTSHNEYIRDLIRRDMINSGDSGLGESILRGLSDIQGGRYERWNKEKFLKDSLEDVPPRAKR